MDLPQLANCTRCSRLFPKTVNLQCGDCVKKEQEWLQKARTGLRQSRSQGGITMSDLAVQVGCLLEEVETFYDNHQLGVDEEWLIISCSKCSEPVRGAHSEGLFCKPCADMLKDEVGSEVLSKNELEDKAQAAERERLKRVQEGSKNHYGLNRNKGIEHREFYRF